MSYPPAPPTGGPDRGAPDETPGSDGAPPTRPGFDLDGAVPDYGSPEHDQVADDPYAAPSPYGAAAPYGSAAPSRTQPPYGSAPQPGVQFPYVSPVSPRVPRAPRAISRAAGTALALGGLVLGVLGGWFLTENVLDGIDADEAAYDATTESRQVPVAVDGTGTGSRLDPFTYGETVETDAWTVSLGEPVDATRSVLADYPNLADDPGMEGLGTTLKLYLVEVRADYRGDDMAEPWLDLTTAFRTNEGESFDALYCGGTPDRLDSVSDLAPGDSVRGNVCIARPVDAVGQWSLAIDWADPVYFTDPLAATPEDDS